MLVKHKGTEQYYAMKILDKQKKPSAVCFALGLCTPQQPGKGMQELLTNEISETGYIVSQQALPRATSQLEDTVVQLLEQICSHLPSEVSQECQDFVDKYGKTVIDFLLSSMAPHTICTLLHLCLGVESPVPVQELCPILQAPAAEGAGEALGFSNNLQGN
ncbi:UNVERIFIED_CONTAM: hypothetical protein FKN15_032159 [Acipenser sinensis]